MSTILFRGTAPALVTPFADDESVDETALRRLIDFVIEGGVEALVVLGTTGENPTVTHDERQRITEVALEANAGRVPVIVGTGTNNTAESVTLTKAAAQAGADGVLVVGPYYNKPTPDGLVAHTAAIADAADLPILLYNVPGRTGSNITAETTLRIADAVPAVFGVKEASGDLAQIATILRDRPDGFAVYAGDDELAVPVIALGGEGVVSVIANALPGPFTQLVRLALEGDFEAARPLFFDLLEPMRACFYEANPGPVKAVLAALGHGSDRMRLPLAPLTADGRRRVIAAYHPFLESTPQA